MKNIWLIGTDYLLGLNGLYNEKLLNMWTRSYKHDNVAVIKVDGVLSPSAWSDERNLISLESLIKTADEDDDIESILLDINSPGGSAEGTMQFANAIKNAKKKVQVFARRMESGALWAGSQGHHIMASDEAIPTIGSVGVYYVHFDYSKYYQDAGYGVTVIQSKNSPNKTLGNSHEPLTPEGREMYQSVADGIYEDFKNALLSSRKKIDESALTGLSYKPKDALALGLIDKIGTFDDALAKAKNYATSKPKYTSMFFPKISSLFVKETPKTDEEGLAKIEAALTEKENQLQQAQMKIESLTAELEAFKAQGNKLTDLEAKIEKLQKDNEALAKFPADEPTKVGSQNDVTNLINNEKKSWETAAHNQILNKRYQKFNKN